MRSAVLIVALALLSLCAAKVDFTVEECVRAPLNPGFEVSDDRTIVIVPQNCCSEKLEVFKDGDTLKIVEIDEDGKICRCICYAKVTARAKANSVVFVDFTGNEKKLKRLGFCGMSTYGRCESDEDCVTDGCSSQVCRSRFEEPVFTTCEWRACYDASAYGLSCRCVDGRCMWA